ncbi:MAG: Uma2 family endonuclease [Thermomicrobiales bacterium]
MAAEPRYISPEEYLARERKAATKSEYLDGRIVAMAGASENHSLLQSTVNALLFFQLRRRGCQIHGSDLRVKVPARRSYMYPDLTIICGNSQFDEDRRDNLLNPTVIIEILSPSTALYDRTEKFARYRQIPTLREYLLIAQDTPKIEHFVRQTDDQWLWSLAEQLTDTITLPSINCTLALADIYADVVFA